MQSKHAFHIHRSDENDEFFSHLEKKDGEIIAASGETYSDLGDCLEAVFVFKQQAPGAPINNREDGGPGRQADYEFEIYRDQSAERAWRWRFQAPNNHITMKGVQGFKSKQAVLKAIAEVQRIACDADVEVIADEAVDVEACAEKGHRPPRARKYRIRVNREKYVMWKPKPLGREIITVAGLAPPEQYQLYQRFRGQQDTPIRLDEAVDLTCPGIERFVTVRLCVTDGEECYA